jgi:WD40 repeat protein
MLRCVPFDYMRHLLTFYWCQSSDEMRHGRIHTLLTDVDRLLLVYRVPIIESALHAYWSALVTMPTRLLLEESGPHDGHGIPLLVTKRAPGWGLRETVLEPRGIGVECIAYAPNGKLIASGGLFAPIIHVWDVVTSMALHTIFISDTQHSISISDTQTVDRLPGVTSIAFSPNSRWIVSGFRDGTVRLWDVVTGSQHRVMRGHTEWVTCVAFSPDGTSIVSCSHDSTLRIWDLGTGVEQLTLMGHTAQVNSLAFAPNGQTIVSASKDGTLRVWDMLTGTQLRVMEGEKGGLDCVAFSPDGTTIASGSVYGTLELWSATNSTRKHALEGHAAGIRSLTFSPDSRSIVSCDGTGLARIWDVTTGIEKNRLTGEHVVTVAYSPDTKSIAIQLSDAIRIRDTLISVATHRTLEGHQDTIDCVAFSADSLLIASGSRDRTARIWDAVTGTERHVMEVGDIVLSIAFSPDNRTVASARGGTVDLWDVASGQKKGSMMHHHSSPVSSVAFSSDGKSLVSWAIRDRTARVWDVVTRAEQHILTCPRDVCRDFLAPVAFSADGKAIVMRETRGSGVVKGFWDLTTTQLEYMESTSPHDQIPPTNDIHTSEQHYFVKSDWIHYSDGQGKPKRVCWLPADRRGTLAYSGKKVCVGGLSGTLTILDFSPVNILQ